MYFYINILSMLHNVKFNAILAYKTFLQRFSARVTISIIKICVRPTNGEVVTLKTGRREVPSSIPGRACRPSRSEFSVVSSETHVNTG